MMPILGMRPDSLCLTSKQKKAVDLSFRNEGEAASQRSWRLDLNLWRGQHGC